MSELTNNMDFTELPEDDLDISAIFGSSGGGASTTNPFEVPKPTEPEKPTPTPPTPQPTVPSEQVEVLAESPEPQEENLFEAFAQESQKAGKSSKQAQPQQESLSLFDKPAIFSYGGVKESIEDGAQTFDELRISKMDDFQELEESKNVSWRVKYAGVTKNISDPKGTTIAKAKEDVEKSKTFLDALKKGKATNPECLIIPIVTAEKKGIASYKGVFHSVEEARQSDKVICLIPARNGQTYELRRTELGEFIAPKRNIVEFSEVRAGFIPALPLIPCELMGQIISFFRSFMGKGQEYEALVHIYWDKETEKFHLHVPKQTVSKISIHADLSDEDLCEERYLHYADIHSHNSMPAKFSAVDDENEKATRLYMVVGRLDRFYPEMTARVSCGGCFIDVDPELVIEGIGDEFPTMWLDKVTVSAPEKADFSSLMQGPQKEW